MVVEDDHFIKVEMKRVGEGIDAPTDLKHQNAKGVDITCIAVRALATEDLGGHVTLGAMLEARDVA